MYDINELVIKQENESRKVGDLLLSGYTKDEASFYGVNYNTPGINSELINNDSYLKGLGHHRKASFHGQTIPRRDDASLGNILFKSSDFIGNTNHTRIQKSCNTIFEENFTDRNWNPNIINTDIQDHIQYSIGQDSRGFRRRS
jgi:hypothetical protein